VRQSVRLATKHWQTTPGSFASQQYLNPCSTGGGLQQHGHCFSDAVAAAQAVAVNDTVILTVPA
jgi:hypothetical protein